MSSARSHGGAKRNSIVIRRSNFLGLGILISQNLRAYRPVIKLTSHKL